MTWPIWTCDLVLTDDGQMYHMAFDTSRHSRVLTPDVSQDGGPTDSPVWVIDLGNNSVSKESDLLSATNFLRELKKLLTGGGIRRVESRSNCRKSAFCLWAGSQNMKCLKGWPPAVSLYQHSATHTPHHTLSLHVDAAKSPPHRPENDYIVNGPSCWGRIQAAAAWCRLAHLVRDLPYCSSQKCCLVSQRIVHSFYNSLTPSLLLVHVAHVRWITFPSLLPWMPGSGLLASTISSRTSIVFVLFAQAKANL